VQPGEETSDEPLNLPTPLRRVHGMLDDLDGLDRLEVGVFQFSSMSLVGTSLLARSAV